MANGWAQLLTVRQQQLKNLKSIKFYLKCAINQEASKVKHTSETFLVATFVRKENTPPPWRIRSQLKDNAKVCLQL